MATVVTPAMSEGLTPHEEKLLQRALAKRTKSGEGFKTQANLRKFLKCDCKSVPKIVMAANRGGISLLNDDDATLPVFSTAPKGEAFEPEMTETNEMTDTTWSIGLPKTNIHTLEQLIEHCQIDLKVWHVERFIANKWEVVMKPAAYTELFSITRGATEHSAEITNEFPMWQRDQKNTAPIHRPLFQVKAFLTRKPVDGAGNVISDESGYIKENARLRSALEKSRRETIAEKKYSKHLALNHLGADDFLAKIDGFMQKHGDLSLRYTRPETHSPLIVPNVRDGHTEDAVALWSDTHFGDRIMREDTSGFPAFDLPISGNRWGYIIKKTKQCLTLHRAMYPLDTLNIWVGGDIGNGILHDSPNSNELFTPAQVHFSYHMLKFAIEDMLTLTEPDALGNVVVNKLKLLFTVGNHMRMDEKMPMKFQAQRTLDWLIYQFVIDRFKGNPKVEIKTEMSPYIFENIRGHRHLFAHGMQVGYKNSPDNQCKSMASFIDRVRALFDSPEWRRANSLMGETFARICIGDIHVPVSFPRLISNGSLNGQNELGVNWTLEPIPVGQQLFGVSDNHLETWKYFLEATHVQKRPEDFNSYGEFAREYAQELGR